MFEQIYQGKLYLQFFEIRGIVKDQSLGICKNIQYCDKLYRRKLLGSGQCCVKPQDYQDQHSNKQQNSINQDHDHHSIKKEYLELSPFKQDTSDFDGDQKKTNQKNNKQQIQVEDNAQINLKKDNQLKTPTKGQQHIQNTQNTNTLSEQFFTVYEGGSALQSTNVKKQEQNNFDSESFMSAQSHMD